MSVAESLRAVRAKIDAAARRAGRDPSEVTLVAVTKTFGLEVVRAAIAAGAVDLGENYLQDAKPKIEALAPDERARTRWHFVGHLQRNKARDAARLFDVVQTLDSPRLAARLGRVALEAERTLEVFAQVNIADETQKSGVAAAETPGLVEQITKTEGLRLTGLMTIHPLSATPDEARRFFARLRELRDEIERAGGAALPELSMGMSGDYEVAIEEGATVVRVGTAIFGARRPKAN